MSRPPKQKTPSRKPFRGDDTHLLPAEMREPYRLWFEFLKAALRDPTISVNRAKYADWGVVENKDFNSWWDSHWRDLFAVARTNVAVLRSKEEFDTAAADASYVVVRVPVSLQAKLRDKEIQIAIKNELRSNPRPKPARLKPYAISNRITRHGEVLRGLLKLYQLSLANARNVDATAVAYYDWAQDWNTKISKNKWNREKTYMPPFLPDFVNAVKAVNSAATEQAKKTARKSTGYDELRNRMKRYLRQANDIAKSTARGIFPGKFDK